MRDIVIVANFVGDTTGKGNNRFLYLAEMLSKYANVELITSNFDHDRKSQREIDYNAFNCKVTALYEPGYKKNICLKRFYSHYIFGKNVLKYLKKRKKPDAIYCAVPSLTAAINVAKYCKKNNLRNIIDVQDLWPESFAMVFSVPVISKIIYAPFYLLENKIFKMADGIFAVSDEYIKRVIEKNNNKIFSHSVYIGTDSKLFETNLKNNNNSIIKPDNNIKICYCGTLGTSYDIKLIIDAINLLKKYKNKIKFFVIGDGPLREEFFSYSLKCDADIIFTGRLPYEKMCNMIINCDIAVNPIISKSVASIINKHADYAMAGLPVINTQQSIEYINLIDEYQMGINCLHNDAKEIADAITYLIDNPSIRKQMGKNAYRCGREKFDRNETYKIIIKEMICTERINNNEK